jgi:hypothetical protein
MTIFERLELIRAGYKRSEIDAMIKADEDAAKAPEQEPKEEPKQEPKKEPEQPKQDEPKQDDEVNRLRQELEQLRKDMQLKNVQSIGLNTNPVVPVEQVLAEAVFGNPSKKE